MKTCSGCGENKPLEDFYKKKSGKHGVGSKCKACLAHYQRKYYYDLSPEEYEEKLKRQGGGCAICGSSGELHVDHSHRTGQVRDLLCRRCNTALGFFEKDANLMRLFVQYMERWSEKGGG
jgi:hypothetical protein